MEWLGIVKWNCWCVVQLNKLWAERHMLGIFIVAPCILKCHWIVTTNKYTKYVLYISLKTLFYTKTLKRLLHVLIAHCLSSSGSLCYSLLKSGIKIVHVSLLVMWQHTLYLRMRCFSAGSGLASQSTPCTETTHTKI
jgi:hypothetical protein